ncbi:MAG: acyl-CoA thioesterase [Muribaculaceae bacterium]|nr:acyl-CoA thioesterase [Muribaculaceae bacterium]
MPHTENPIFSLEMEVRDYELDTEQIVNNANYLHYMEHTRHKFCEAAGVRFIDLHNDGIDAVVRKIDIEYFSPLRSGDIFISSLNLERKGARFIFHQVIRRNDGELITKGDITCVMLKDGKMSRGDEVAALFSKYL